MRRRSRTARARHCCDVITPTVIKLLLRRRSAA